MEETVFYERPQIIHQPLPLAITKIAAASVIIDI